MMIMMISGLLSVLAVVGKLKYWISVLYQHQICAAAATDDDDDDDDDDITLWM